MRALLALVEGTALREQIDEVCLLGDQHHTHNIIRAEVMAMYRETFKRWRKLPFKTRVLVGNHDYAGEGHPVHSMLMYDELIEVVDHPVFDCGRLYMPYYADREAFVRDANTGAGTTLICHQTFHGSTYENGFLAEDGVEPTLLVQNRILSGHIHTPQEFGKVKYVGAPRWRSLTDANVERAVWLYEFQDDGSVESCESVDTGTTCRQIRYIEVTPSAPFDESLDPAVDWRVDIRGPADFVEERKKALSLPGVRVRCFRTDQATAKVRESEGIAPAFRNYLSKYTARHGTSTDVLGTMAKGRLDV